MSPRSLIAGWGRSPVVDAQVVAAEDLERATRGAALSRGLGRAYGDAALPAPGADHKVVRTPLADRILAFDPATGVLRAEAGLSLRDLMRVFLTRGWFTPVSTGTQYVTLGGMIAADVHGKNHHVHGTIGNFVQKLRIRVGTGDVLECSRTEHPDLFVATLGGMGLTGHVLEVELRLEKLPSPWIHEQTERFGSLAEVFSALGQASATSPMTVAWVDTSAPGPALGRGVVMRGRWAPASEAPPEPPRPRAAIAVPNVFPSGVMNRWSVQALNAGYYAFHGAAPHDHLVNPEAYFYLLDMLTEWNRGYGKRGFTQIQCVLPRDGAVHEAYLRRFQDLGGCSFVTVFKDCGPVGEGLLSFPQEGTSLALDIPITSGTPALARELHAFVIDHGGRIYLAKDSYATPGEIRAMYPRLDAFLSVRETYDPDRTIGSALSKRLFGW
jgi:decaprenylphospho-beta-D-ribofuranose 2-oxidase